MAFQAQCKKLPKSLRGWPAFKDLKKKIDDFLEILPLIQALCNKSMRQRHWQAVMTTTGKTFNLSEDVFKLQHLLDADLLANYEELEELTSAAVKEEQVEVKLGAVEEDWADQVFNFANYKHRGQVILQAGDTAEIVEKLEDTQMALGSMATNRCSGCPPATNQLSETQTRACFCRFFLIAGLWILDISGLQAQPSVGAHAIAPLLSRRCVLRCPSNITCQRLRLPRRADQLALVHHLGGDLETPVALVE